MPRKRRSYPAELKAKPIPILGGARLSGKVSNSVTVGVLNMQTESMGQTAANNFTVARVRQSSANRAAADLRASSTVGDDAGSLAMTVTPVRRQINPDQWVCFVRETSCRFTVLRGVHRFSRLRCASVLRLTCSRRARIAGRRPA